jgi:hypothetical protein
MYEDLLNPPSDLLQCMKIYSSTVRFNTMYEDLLLHSQIYYNVWRFTPPLSDLIQWMKIYSSAIKFNTMYEDLLLHYQFFVWITFR